MDFEQVARELEIEKSEYVSLLRRFDELTRNDLSLLYRALRKSDLNAVHAAAHSIKGASASLSLWEIYDVASIICETARNGSMESVEELSMGISSELDSLLRSLSDAGEGPADDA